MSIADSKRKLELDGIVSNSTTNLFSVAEAEMFSCRGRPSPGEGTNLCVAVHGQVCVARVPRLLGV